MLIIKLHVVLCYFALLLAFLGVFVYVVLGVHILVCFNFPFGVNKIYLI